MKRIQAQRKFAQGAPIPSSNFSNSDRRLDVTTNKEESKNVVHNNTPVKTFLDFVSFNQIHEHRVPVVVLERLRTNPSNPFIINKKIEELEGSIEPKLTGNINSNGDAMSLRSHISVGNKSEEDITDSDEPDVSIKKNILQIVPETTIKLKNLTLIEPKQAVVNLDRLVTTPKSVHKSSVTNIINSLACTTTSDATVDDDTPLAHYAVKKKQFTVNKTKKRLSLIKKSYFRKQVYKGRKEITEDNVNDNSDASGNMVCTKTFTKVLHEFPKRANQIESNMSSDTSEVLSRTRSKGQRNRLQIKNRIMSNRNLKKSLSPGLKKLCNGNSTRRSYSLPKRQRGLPNRANGGKLKSIIDNAQLNLRRSSRNSGRKHQANNLDETSSSSTDIVSENVIKKISVHLKNIQSTNSSSNHSTPAPSSSQETLTTSSCLQDACTMLNDIIDLTEMDDDINIESCLKCQDIINIMQLDQLSDKTDILNCGNELPCCAPVTVDSRYEVSLDLSIQQNRFQIVNSFAHNDVTLSKPVLMCNLISTSNIELHDSNNLEDIALSASETQSSSPNLVTSNSSELMIPETETYTISSSQTSSPEHCLNYEQQTISSTLSSNSKQPSNYEQIEIETLSTFSSTQSSSSKPLSNDERREKETSSTWSSTQSSGSKRPSNNDRGENKTCTRSSTQSSSSKRTSNYERQKNKTLCTRSSKQTSGSKKTAHYERRENEKLCTRSSIQSSGSKRATNYKQREKETSCTRSSSQSSTSKRASNYDQREKVTLCKRSSKQSSASKRASNNDQREKETSYKSSSTQYLGSRRPSNYEQRHNEKLCTRSTTQSSDSSRPLVYEQQESETSSTISSTQSLGSMRPSLGEDLSKLRPPSNLDELTKQQRPSTDLNQSSQATRHPLVAPVYTPTAEEFSDPIAYFNSILPAAEIYGICKVVPPADFIPLYHVNEEMAFNVTNQYIARLFRRWGPSAKEMCTIKAHLASQSVVFKRPPLYEGMEVNLPKLYQLVQRHGGLKKVIERKRWGRVAEEMRFMRDRNPEKKLDQLYVKYLLPYDTLSNEERDEIMSNVEHAWSKKYRKMMKRALDPFHRQYKLLSGCDSSEEEDDEDSDEDKYITRALAEAEECVVPGRKMNLATFRKIAVTALDTYFTSTTYPTPAEVEEEYWRIVLDGTEHVCVNSASIDTGTAGYGFTTNKDEKYSDHPWNLKMLANNRSNILRYLGEVLGVTVPTLHLGMVFSTSCWHRDPHSLPWMEFMHSGPPKIWYGIANGQSKQFRKAVESLCPTSCQNKSIWLPSDIAMIPPKLLLERDVSLSRVEQRSGEYIIVFPKAYSCSISTGFTVSESVYFASMSWLEDGLKCFHEAQMSCEPTMISVESLLVAMVRDADTPLAVLRPALATLSRLLHIELRNRRIILTDLANYPKSIKYLIHEPGAWNVREQDECEVCRKTLFVSRIRGLTKNNTSLCLEHANQIIQEKASKNLNVPHFEVDFFLSVEEIDNLLSSASKRIHDLEAFELLY